MYITSTYQRTEICVGILLYLVKIVPENRKWVRLAVISALVGVSICAYWTSICAHAGDTGSVLL